MADDRDDFARQLAGMLAASKDRTALAESVYDALNAAGKLSSHRRLTYRCPNRRRCLLLDVFEIPQGFVMASPRYKLSPVVNEASSNEAGRAANTEDGERRWKRRVYFAQDAANFTVNCDHVRHGIIDKADVETALEAGRAEVVFHPQR